MSLGRTVLITGMALAGLWTLQVRKEGQEIVGETFPSK